MEYLTQTTDMVEGDIRDFDNVQLLHSELGVKEYNEVAYDVC